MVSLAPDLQAHIDKLDALKKEIADWGAIDFLPMLRDSDLVELALKNDPQALEDYCQQFFEALVKENADLFSDAARSAHRYFQKVIAQTNALRD